ncbi:MAG: hypothetical protein ACXIUQ_17580 [Cecembia sp.]
MQENNDPLTFSPLPESPCYRSLSVSPDRRKNLFGSLMVIGMLVTACPPKGGLTDLCPVGYIRRVKGLLGGTVD